MCWFSLSVKLITQKTLSLVLEDGGVLQSSKIHAYNFQNKLTKLKKKKKVLKKIMSKSTPNYDFPTD